MAEIKKAENLDRMQEVDDIKKKTGELGLRETTKPFEQTDIEAKELMDVKDQINEYLAEKYQTTPEYEDLRSKSKIGKLSSKEKTRYESLKDDFPERSVISEVEKNDTARNYMDAKKNHIDFQIVDTFDTMHQEFDRLKAMGRAMDPQELDLMYKVDEIYVGQMGKKVDQDVSEIKLKLAGI